MNEQKLPLPIVDVIIPVFNYGTEVLRAIESVKKQTITNLACYIINDGSTDDTEQVILEAIKNDPRFHYIYQNNQGVANARNKGVFSGVGKYVACLDADDAIKPAFLEACVLALEKDPAISIAYTGLWYKRPDGSEGLSSFPGENDYDKQLKKLNQLPTCNVARREVWERLGGQRQRYAPQGAGEEDAEMWLRAGAYGFRAKKVTDAGLFLYSWLSGRVSGSKTHKMTDYMVFHPWVEDEMYPFMSIATPKKFSHPVRQYDEPTYSVIIPVGEGHEEQIINCLDSLEGQTSREWEAIVVWDSPNPIPDYIKMAYPYIQWLYTGGKKGAGYARNRGVEIARAPFIVFLDADDWFYPSALEHLFDEWRRNPGIIYSDYVGKAFIDLKAFRDKDRILFYDEKTTEAVISYRSFDYVCERAVAQPDPDMYIWCLVTALVPKTWHDEIGGFDEKMPSWEDWDYYIRMAKAGKCFYRVEEPLVVYRFYTGGRRDVGLHDHRNLIQYLIDKYKDTKTMACAGCGQKNRSEITPRPPQNTRQQESITMAKDDEYVMAIYNHPNRGQHRVIGPATGMDYGHRGGGERFLVNRRDVATNPSLFIAQEVELAEPPSAPRPPTAPPIDKSTFRGLAEDITTGKTQKTPKKSTRKRAKSVTASPKLAFDLQAIAGITPTIANELKKRNITTPQEILKFGEDNLQLIEGMTPVRASAIMAATRQVLE